MSNSMNKSDLVDAIAATSGLSKADSEKALKATIEAITEQLSKGGEVALTGFCSLKVKARSARTGRNPKTGEPMTIPAATTVAFKPGKLLKDAVQDVKA